VSSTALRLASRPQFQDNRGKEYWGERGYGGWLRFQPRLRCGTWKNPLHPLHPLINPSIHVGFPHIREEKKAGPVQDDRMAVLLLPRLLFVLLEGEGGMWMRPCSMPVAAPAKGPH
jgi:hypothetical protein